MFCLTYSKPQHNPTIPEIWAVTSSAQDAQGSYDSKPTYNFRLLWKMRSQDLHRAGEEIFAAEKPFIACKAWGTSGQVPINHSRVHLVQRV